MSKIKIDPNLLERAKQAAASAAMLGSTDAGTIGLLPTRVAVDGGAIHRVEATDLVEQGLEWGHVVVTLEQHGAGPDSRDHVAHQAVDLVAYIGAVGIDDQAGHSFVPGDVELLAPRPGETLRIARQGSVPVAPAAGRRRSWIAWPSLARRKPISRGA